MSEYVSRYNESYRHNKMDDFVEDVFFGDYEKAWQEIVAQESNSDFAEAFDFIARMNDIPERSDKDFRDRHEGAEILEYSFGNDYEKLYTEYVIQMSDSDFKSAEKYIRRMYR